MRSGPAPTTPPPPPSLTPNLPPPPFPVYELRGPGLDGAVKHFRKPWAMTAVMFAGMAFCLPVAMVQERRAAARRRRAAAERPASAPLLGVPEQGEDGGASSSHHHTLRGEARRAALLAVPTAFDLVATVLMNVGLLSVTVRGSGERDRETERGG